MSTIQRCVTLWIKESLRVCRRGSGEHRCTSERTDQRIRHLTFRDPFSAASDTRSRLISGAGGHVSTQTLSNRLNEVQLRARIPVTGLPLTAQLKARHQAWCHRPHSWTVA
ncbi:hypothetical protein TNCV_2862901 [Trichonephila clavipes]|nr:hypothetical protein TNCV_2862901 [Trichonephila clavipes]